MPVCLPLCYYACINTCIHTHIHTHTCIHACTHAYIYEYVSTQTRHRCVQCAHGAQPLRSLRPCPAFAALRCSGGELREEAKRVGAGGRGACARQQRRVQRRKKSFPSTSTPLCSALVFNLTYRTASYIERDPSHIKRDRMYDTAVPFAGFAFEAYNEPSQNDARWERGADGCDVAFMSEEFARECYSGVLYVNKPY